jgi:hypothetical protein
MFSFAPLVQRLDGAASSKDSVLKRPSASLPNMRSNTVRVSF